MEPQKKPESDKAKGPISPGPDQSQIPTASPSNSPAAGPIGWLGRGAARLAEFLKALFGVK
jgi:hypothetical protein